MFEGEYEAALQKPFKIDDEVIIKGTIPNDDQKFIYLDFKIDENNMPYSLKTELKTNTVQQGYKKDGEWHMTKGQNTYIDGPGTEFVLTVRFGKNEFLVYSGDKDRRLRNRFEYQFDISTIKYINLNMGRVKNFEFR